ncbi:MAG: amidohydrolase [Fimbriiglobus sp.]|jgi:hippurate hydrolase|nr:amidohydrolase [Fimbriiglobus sp.]
MNRLPFALLLLPSALFAADPKPAPPPHLADVDQQIDTHADDLLKLYKHLHSHPELSLQEKESAARMAAELEKLGFAVTTKVGGHGVVGVLKNGDGPTVWYRADMDALPVTEQTGLDYASKVRTKDRSGNDVGVMHACGHDVHMTCFVGVARTLVALKKHWSGTLVLVAQPAEEIGAGARMMIEDGLFKRFPKPDFAVALHADAQLPVGQIHYSEGLAMANVDTVDLTIKGKGGHGAAPHTTVDPVVLAAQVIVDLQTIVSREVEPGEPAVVTVGSIHAGTKHNIIPNECKLQLTVRSTTDKTRDAVLKAIERKAKAHAEAARAPAPEMKVHLDEFCPLLSNDPKLTKRLVTLFGTVLGPENLIPRKPIMGGEDFSRFGSTGAPICMYFLGTIDPEKYAASKKDGGKPLPSTHNDGYAPLPGPSIKVGVRTMSLAVLDLMAKK